MKLSIIIPVYNEVATFEKLLKKVLKVPLKKEVLIIEGGSTDGTVALVRKYDQYKDKNNVVRTFFVTEHYGKGYKVRFGLKKATGDIIIIQDADLEYEPGEYPEIISPIVQGKTKFVLGSRHLKKHTWKIREFANMKFRWQAQLLNIGDRVLRKYFKLLYRVNITDPNTMFKVFHKDCVQHIALKSNDFDLDMELLIKIIKQGHKPIELPVSFKGRGYDEGKKIKAVRDGLKAVWAITKFRFKD